MKPRRPQLEKSHSPKIMRRIVISIDHGDKARQQADNTKRDEIRGPMDETERRQRREQQASDDSDDAKTRLGFIIRSFHRPGDCDPARVGSPVGEKVKVLDGCGCAGVSRKTRGRYGVTLIVLVLSCFDDHVVAFLHFLSLNMP